MKKTTALWLTLILTLSFAVQLTSVYANETSIKMAESTILIGTGENPYTDQYDIFDYTGRYLPNLPVKYYVNPSGNKLRASDAIAAVKASFETWDNAVDNPEMDIYIELFYDNVQQTMLQGKKYDGRNVISWGKLGQRILAICYTWYYHSGKIVEFGIVFNTLYSWGIDPDGEGGTTINAYDIQNIGTHEAGHTLSLGDLYSGAAKELTMYGYGARGETKKRSLGYGDIQGVRFIYGP
jgi:hypothetical protein